MSQVFWTRRKKENADYFPEWYEYLSQTFKEGDEPIGHRYLRTIVTRMKFELSFGISLICMCVGIIWLNLIQPSIAVLPMIVQTVPAIVISVYLIRESNSSSELLSKVRSEMLARLR